MASVSSATSTAASVAAATSSASSTTAASSTSTTDSIDWSALLEAAVQAKLASADSIDIKVTANEAKIAAYEQMQTLLETVMTSAQALRAPSGTTLQSSDAFQMRTAYLTANGSVTASSAVGVAVDAGAQTGSFELVISKLAKAQKVAGTVVTSSTAVLGYTGAISLGVEGGTAKDIEFTADMSLAEIAEAINAEKATTGVSASVLKVAESQYRLILSTVDTGQQIVASDTSGTALVDLGILADDASFANELQASSQAVIKIDGIEVTRASNDIDDVLSGVTIHLYELTPTDTSITVEVGSDLSTIKSSVTALVDAYNAYRDFAYDQQQYSSDASASVLFGDGTLRTVNSALSDALNTSVLSTSLASLGITFDETNHLVVDDDALDSALLADVDAVQSLLSFQMTTSSSNLMLLNRGTEVPADFTLDITTNTSGAMTGVTVNGNSGLFTVSGTRLLGVAGTAYEGYSLVYSGSSSTSISVSFSTGIAELLFNAADDASNDTDGTLTTLMDNLDAQNDDLEAKADDIRSRAETYRTNLAARYAKYQAAIAAAESSQSYLTTLLDTWNSTS